mmetsp:Transcript_5623/g.14463  ORF Transcript_5623/g.14463 Transcript_5623/m.14463 type:complete len:248 (-) Transcript_5623:211-954(-)|eukprot:CAMPEP_0197413610 /NCGR_PEP_ID=MMETSP1170-20131217/467_1 /TAXON_ID=54406 /ORGANISM="Sarcinochrysis sp, Strain CCMP770" /LENGTH=247 /DNA_ID=CAMNT_0042940219 /DNA_START=51 /DNA_END=794 /DNA_ORIENTATION=-
MSTKKGAILNMDLKDEMDKAIRILEAMVASPKSGPAPGILKQAKGLAFLRVAKGGLAISARVGTGLIVAKLDDGWSAPSAIGTAGLSWGFQIGAQVSDFLIVLNTKEAIDAISGHGKVSLGGQISAAAGPVGAGRESAIMSTGDVPAVFTYSINKGVSIGASLEGSVMLERKEVNQAHYGIEGVQAKQLLTGEVKPTADAADLLKALANIDSLPDAPPTKPSKPDAPAAETPAPAEAKTEEAPAAAA